ncbi:MAG: hydroxylase [Longispora sp.]|nr:hydroxylase [Longispora sp. (in: high G+C Gram-positive bacteria)]
MTESLPPVIDLLAVLAYGELSAFDRMSEDARLAPDLARRATMSEMAGAEIAHYRRLADRLTELGVDPVDAMTPFMVAIDEYHDQTQPRDWLEGLVKAYVGDAIADDFYREVAGFLGGPDGKLILDVLHEDRYADFVAGEIRGAIEADPKVANRLALWARRLVGEALSQAQRVAAEREALTEVVIQGSGDLTALNAMFKRLTSAHTARMEAVGLNT